MSCHTSRPADRNPTTSWRRRCTTWAVCLLTAVVAGLFVDTAAAHAAGTDLPNPEGGYGSYHQEFLINGLPRYSATQVMAQFNSDVDGYFPFAGCGRHLEVGEVCPLASPVGVAPVQVIAVTNIGFALRSLPGHPEGAGRTIRFMFVPLGLAGYPASKQLIVDAWGPVNGASLLGPLNSGTTAFASWSLLTGTINTRFPQAPPCAGYCGTV